MSKEILILVDALSNMKRLSKDVVFVAAEEGIKEALILTARKKYGEDIRIRVSIDRDTGAYEVLRIWEVVEDDQVLHPDYQISLSDAKKAEKTDIEVGAHFEEPITEIEFGRIVSRNAKQTIMKKIREAELYQIADSYRGRKGELLFGAVLRVTRDFVSIDLGNGVEGVFLREEMLPRDIVRVGDRLMGCLYEVSVEPRGIQLRLSRIRNEMLMKLFEREVPEIEQQLIEIKGAARDAGIRAKIAVKTNDKRIDPIGACVGMRGARVQAVSNELGGERVDIFLWDDNPAQLVINAMAPAEVLSIVVDEDSHTIDMAVEEAQLSQAIGKNGQNVRLASQLTGWNINVMTKEEFLVKRQDESQKIVKLFVNELGVDDELGQVLADQGFTSIEEIAYVPVEELLAIEGFDDEIVQALRSRAKDILLTKAIASDNTMSGEAVPAEDLLSIKGMTNELAQLLAKHGIVTREDLAEQAVADLLEIASELEPGKAAELIMTARAPWFEGEKK